MREDPHVAATLAGIDHQHLLPFLTAADVAVVLSISPRTVRQMVRDGRLAAVSTSASRGRLRISRQALRDFLTAAAVVTSDTPGSEGSR